MLLPVCVLIAVYFRNNDFWWHGNGIGNIDENCNIFWLIRVYQLESESCENVGSKSLLWQNTATEIVSYDCQLMPVDLCTWKTHNHITTFHIIYPLTIGTPYISALNLANLPSLHDCRERINRQFLRSIFHFLLTFYPQRPWRHFQIANCICLPSPGHTQKMLYFLYQKQISFVFYCFDYFVCVLYFILLLS